jgi:hypothetical protein
MTESSGNTMEKTFGNLTRTGRKVACMISVAALCGCAVNPIARWEPPKSSDVPSYTLDYAKTYAQYARRAYQQTIDQQTRMTSDLSSGLIGLGAVIAGLALSNAHRDAIVGGALIGGTAYALGNWNFSKQRLLVYQAGVESINCALRAVAPLDMSDADLGQLNLALAEVEITVPEVQKVTDRARSNLAKLAERGLTSDRIRSADAAIAEADRSVVVANAVLVAGRQLSTKVRRAGTELINTIDRIGAAVDKAALDTLPDLSAVPKVIGGLAGFAGGFAPGAGLEQSIPLALASYDKTQKTTTQGLGGIKDASGKALLGPSQQEVSALNTDIQTMVAQAQKLATSASRVRARVSGYEGAAADGLNDCGVAEISTMLRVIPEKVVFTGGADETNNIMVSGGKKPYVAILQQMPAEGLTIRNPAPFDSTIQVIAGKSLTLKKTFNLMIMDSSSPSKIVSVPINVAGGAEPAGKVPAIPTLETLAAQINELGSFKVGDTELAVSNKAKRNGDKVELALSCNPPPPPPSCLDGAAVRDQLLSMTEAAPALGAGDPKFKDKVIVKSKPEACFCGGGVGPQGLGGKKKK